MRRFEFKDGKSHKFWEIEVEGDGFTVRFGKFGTDGQVQKKTSPSEAKAKTEADKLIASKTKKGYVEVEPDAKVQAQAKAKTAAVGSRNLALESAILDDPDDVGAWQVYFDWLQSQGDIWGERGNLGIAASKAKGPAKTKLNKQIAEFDTEHGEALYGKSFLALLKKDDFAEVAKLTDKYGLIWSATVKSPEFEWGGTAPNTILAALVKSSAARLLTDLVIGLMDSDYPVDLQKAIEAITKAGKLESVRSLFLGDFDYPDETEISWVEVGKVSKVLPVVPNLRSLKVRGAAIALGKLDHSTLESLVIETGGLPKSAVASVGQAELPELTNLEVWFGRDEYGGKGTVTQLAPLFAGVGVPKLVSLGLKNCEWQDKIAVALTKSDLLAQLTSVDLSMGTMHDAGIEAIIANAAKYSHLKSLDVSQNYLTDDQVKRLKKALGKIVDASGQQKPDMWDDKPHYYTTVGE